MVKKITLIYLVFLLSTYLYASNFPEIRKLQTAKPESVGVMNDINKKIDNLINESIKNGETPGATILVARKGKIIHRKAYGYKQIVPKKEVMSPETIFDIASVSKPVGTSTSIMKLIEDGKIRLVDKVSKYIPEYTNFFKDGEEGKSIRIYHLLTHTSGLPPYTPAADLEKQFGKPCPDKVIQKIATIKKTHDAGEHFEYSCLGFITLAEIVKRVSGLSIDEFSKQRIFKPLNMNNTFYCPKKKYVTKIAATEVFDTYTLRGIVHDPLAQLMDGKSGNAGVFTNIDDLAIFAQMILNGGIYDGTRILSPLTVDKWTSLYPKTAFSGRSLGWDVSSAYSSNLGDIFPLESFGHTGFTGTSLCIDKETETFIILLANRVHIKGGNVISLRGKIANVVASSIITE